MVTKKKNIIDGAIFLAIVFAVYFLVFVRNEGMATLFIILALALSLFRKQIYDLFPS